MAAIDRKRKIIFVHIYRTGGNTIRRILGLRNRPAEIHGVHCLAEHAKRAFETNNDLATWNNSFKFTMVRNPFSWLVSTFNYVLRSKIHNERPIAQRGFPHYLNWVANVGLNQDRPYGANRHAILYDFIHDTNGNLLVDFVGRFEKYDKDVKFICKKAGHPISQIPKVNASRYIKKTYRDYYTRPEVLLVRKVWAKDLEHFGYAF